MDYKFFSFSIIGDDDKKINTNINKKIIMINVNNIYIYIYIYIYSLYNLKKNSLFEINWENLIQLISF